MRARSAAFIASLTALGMMFAPVVTAQDLGGDIKADFNVQNFDPAPSPYGIFNLDASQAADRLQVSGGLILHYDKNPLVFTPDDGGDKIPILEDQMVAEALFAVGVTEALEVGLAFPVYLLNSASVQDVSIDGATIGDLRLRTKYSLLSAETDAAGLAMVIQMTLPTGDSDAFTSDGQVAVRPGIVVDKKIDRLLIAVNLGANLQSERDFGNLAVGSVLVMGAGLQYEILENRLLLGTELFGSTSFDDFFKPEETPLEGLIGMKYRTDFGLNFETGIGRGLVAGYGAPAIRIFSGLRYAEYDQDWDKDGILNVVDDCPKTAEDLDQFEDEDGCPEPDNDGDGVPDISDTCPNEAEDADGFEDEDGCPDLDNDKDSVPDTEDKCPAIAGPASNQGCPIPDTDKDGMPDDVDQCPLDAEDKDGFQDEDGCPDRDNDKDGVLDKDDKCPMEPETINQFEDSDGCPDKGITVLPSEIKILDRIYFQTNKARIADRSKPLLRDVATVLKNYPRIRLVEIQGHTDDRSDDAYNLRLSDARAKAVYNFLTRECGVASDRLRPMGYGETAPAVPIAGKTGEELAAAREKNRRVQFIILNQKD